MADVTPTAIREGAPSPWWPCPECGGVHFMTRLVFERGSWTDHQVYECFDPPRGHAAGIGVDVTCVQCGHEFNIAETYQWGVYVDDGGGIG